jgi:hypothetical protein
MQLFGEEILFVGRNPGKNGSFLFGIENSVGLRSTTDLWSCMILEETIAQALCLKLKLPYDEKGPMVFAGYISELKKAYCQKTE